MNVSSLTASHGVSIVPLQFAHMLVKKFSIFISIDVQGNKPIVRYKNMNTLRENSLDSPAAPDRQSEISGEECVLACFGVRYTVRISVRYVAGSNC